MLILTHDTLRNPAILEVRSLPRRFLGRVMPWPRQADWRVSLRLVFEIQLLRYLAVLLPFVGAMLVWPELAFPLAQAPLAMIVVIALVEVRLLALSPGARERLLSSDEADRILDTMRLRARRCLSRIAARQGLDEGELHLVIEQSGMARVPPLTLVSVQAEAPARVLRLDAGDRAELARLFDDRFTERDLQRANLRTDTFLRMVAVEARSVSAHQRLAARLEKRAEAEAPA
ncbi:hypothetical protein [Thetidibacter halocola]|uniref:Uncharacterized protein n=1 Tax=Thetidibacter halocola TaxID=2827239 RepID=A0A8J7WDG0_9RHOB|nr:hypothetical protein [Thetidibacter halocola]MBS0123118.1 hypothetical protein [Thetidibacter halocola]